METQFHPGAVDIQELVLITPAGKELDIVHLFLEMNIYENIFSSSLSGVVTLSDTFNLISTLPLLGEETLRFKYKVVPNDDIRTSIFKVYKVADREIQGNKQLYKLHFTTEEMYIDTTMNISKTFTGTADSIINQLLVTHLKTKKTITFDAAGNQLVFTVPWWSPFKCAAWASQKAVSGDKNRTSDYLFYETLSGYKFRNISDAKTQPPKAYVSFDHTRAVSDDFTRQFGEEMGKVLNFNMPLIVDQLDRFRHDLYKTHTYAHDITFKSVNIYEYDLSENWDKRPSLNEHLQYTTKLSEFVSPSIKVANEASYSHDTKSYDWQGLVTSQRKASVMLNEMVKINIELWGRMNLEPGDVVYFEMGKYTQDDTELLDLYYSGRYMISAIQHRFAPREYKMYAQLVKDSVLNSFN